MTAASASAQRRPAIAGLGLTEVGKVYGRHASEFAAEAVRRAAVDAGLTLTEIDGLLVAPGVTGGVDMGLQTALGLNDLRLLYEMRAYGCTAVAMVQTAAMAVQTGMADVVACVWADAPLQPGIPSSESFRNAGSRPSAGWTGLSVASGFTSANISYALAARRHMERFGTSSEHLGAIAIAQRDWAAMNPLAQYREPLTMESYLSSRWVAEPFRLLDCCVISNGGAAVIVTSVERARDLRQPPLELIGWAQAHPGHAHRRDENFGIISGAARSGPAALRMAGVVIEDIDVVQLYDCYTFTVLISLEDYGFCAKGEGGPFAASGVLGPEGNLKVNTGGGELSGYYLWGMTPLSEGIIQARGQADDRQVDDHDLVLVSGNGGILDHHGTLILSSRIG